jgi:hypothetical protein
VLSAVAMFSGAALVLTVVTRLSLGLTLLCGVACVGLLGRLCWTRVSLAARSVLVEHIRTGLLAGLVGTIAYDLARAVVVLGLSTGYRPFDIFPLFGKAILGETAPAPAVLAAGVIYHYVNGAAFSTGYSILFRRRSFAFGIAWALGLEAAMLLIYPRWLPAEVGRVLGEFEVVSVVGHLAYGTTIGLICQRVPPRGRLRLSGLSR